MRCILSRPQTFLLANQNGAIYNEGMHFHAHIMLTGLLLGCGTSSIEVSATSTEKNTVNTGETNNTDNGDTEIDETEENEDTDEQSDNDDEGRPSDSGEALDTNEDDEEQPNIARIADFSLPDINSGSPTFGQTISPRDYIQQITGWYFVKAT